MRLAPYQRTISGGISLPTRCANAAGWPLLARTLWTMVLRISARVPEESRNEICCAQGIPVITLRPYAAALSRSHFGAGVKVRKLLIPSSDIKAKSSSTVGTSGNGRPLRESANGPYVTPFKKNFSELRQKNFPKALTFSPLVIGASRGSGGSRIGTLTIIYPFSRILMNAHS